MWREFLDFDTYSEGRGSTVKSIITGRTASYPFRAIAGVANTGDLQELDRTPLCASQLVLLLGV